jgi:hypothetical protein
VLPGRLRQHGILSGESDDTVRAAYTSKCPTATRQMPGFPHFAGQQRHSVVTKCRSSVPLITIPGSREKPGSLWFVLHLRSVPGRLTNLSLRFFYVVQSETSGFDQVGPDGFPRPPNRDSRSSISFRPASSREIAASKILALLIRLTILTAFFPASDTPWFAPWCTLAASTRKRLPESHEWSTGRDSTESPRFEVRACKSQVSANPESARNPSASNPL